MRDPQKQRVYSWEHSFSDWNRSGYSLKECRAAIRWACKLYGLKTPPVKSHRTKHFSFSVGGDEPYISLGADQRNVSVALHEAAHYICDRIFGDKLPDHSPEWMGIFLWLLEGYRVAPRTALHASARAKKIKWVATWLVSPKRLGRSRA